MKKFVADTSFWEVFPEAKIEILTVEGINNEVVEENKADYYDKLNRAAKEARNYLTEEPFSQNEVIAQWRQAFTQFKTKKGARSSIEALLKRASQGREFVPISPLVDIYNSISLRFGVPCGGEDLDTIVGDLHLGKAQGGENFLPLGAEADAPTLPEEIIYYDKEGAVCRCFNWREAQRTMLTKKTTNAVLVIEAVNAQQAEVAGKAMTALQEDIERTFGVTSTRQTVTKEQPEITL